MTDAPASHRDLDLFPLRAVLFPGGLLGLKVFEARYLDLIGACLREGRPFGVVGLRQGHEVRQGNEAVELEDVGTLADILEADGDQPGILQLRCRGGQRFRIGRRWQEPSGLWRASVELLPHDALLAPPADQQDCAVSLSQAIGNLHNQGVHPCLKPYRFDDAGWVANRWCELLPLSQQARQKLMELDDPLVRLNLVHEFLRSKGVLG
jgi:Lon protease-like protein